MKHISSRYPVTTSPKQIFSSRVKDFQTLEIYAVGAIEIGIEGVSIGSGIPISAGESRFISHLDFRKDDKDVQEDYLNIYAVASSATTVQVSAWRR